jgi:hypothetical protein|tara:strand:+ start:1526 stop:1909 length:384 start_codon:yes stop_codon:yes gene_type:complete
MFLKKKEFNPNHINAYHLEDLSPSTNQVRFSSISVLEHELKERKVPFRDEEDACYAFQIISERMMRDNLTLFGNVFLLSENGVKCVSVIVNDKGYTIDEKGKISVMKDEGVYDELEDVSFVVRKEAA